MTTLAAFALSIGTVTLPDPGQAQQPVFPSLPRGTYVAAQYTCTEYIEAGLLRLDANGISPPKSTCKIVSADERSATYESTCHENDTPSEQERVKLKIEPLTKQSLRVNGIVYYYCKGL